jgi:hypothetical protein
MRCIWLVALSWIAMTLAFARHKCTHRFPFSCLPPLRPADGTATAVPGGSSGGALKRVRHGRHWPAEDPDWSRKCVRTHIPAGSKPFSHDFAASEIRVCDPPGRKQGNDGDGHRLDFPCARPRACTISKSPQSTETVFQATRTCWFSISCCGRNRAVFGASRLTSASGLLPARDLVRMRHASAALPARPHSAWCRCRRRARA